MAALTATLKDLMGQHTGSEGKIPPLFTRLMELSEKAVSQTEAGDLLGLKQTLAEMRFEFNTTDNAVATAERKVKGLAPTDIDGVVIDLGVPPNQRK